MFGYHISSLIITGEEIFNIYFRPPGAFSCLNFVINDQLGASGTIIIITGEKYLIIALKQAFTSYSCTHILLFLSRNIIFHNGECFKGLYILFSDCCGFSKGGLCIFSLPFLAFLLILVIKMTIKTLFSSC